MNKTTMTMKELEEMMRTIHREKGLPLPSDADIVWMTKQFVQDNDITVYTPPTDEQIAAAMDTDDYPIALAEDHEALSKAFLTTSNISLEPVKDSPCRNTCVTHGRCSCGTQFHRMQQFRRMELSVRLQKAVSHLPLPVIEFSAVDIPVDLPENSLSFTLSTMDKLEGDKLMELWTVDITSTTGLFLQIIYEQYFYYWRLRNITNNAWDEWNKTKYESDKE